MEMSNWGTKMAQLSGIRSIMEDIALASADGSSGEWLNLSPGNPARIPEVVETWRRLEGEALRDSFAGTSCQYGPSRGVDTLVEAIVDYFNAKYGWDIGPQNVIVGPGCQMLCFMATTIFTGPSAAGRRKLVLPYLPDYTGYHGLSLEKGDLAGIEPLVETQQDRNFQYQLDADRLWRQESPGMLLVSSPANPTGRSADAAEVAELVKFAESHDIPLVIDHAYGAPFPQVARSAAAPLLDPHVINIFTLSKAGLPGERIAFAIGPVPAISTMVSFLGNSALHAPQLIQATVEIALRGGELDMLATDFIRPYYQRKRLFAEKTLHDSLPESVNWRLHSCDGGMFCWLWIDEPWFDDLEMYEAMKRKRVFIVPGRHFFTDPTASAAGTRCIRISMSSDESVIAEGIARIAETLDEIRRAKRNLAAT
jgi:valine--pyruvate aminotransferase